MSLCRPISFACDCLNLLRKEIIVSLFLILIHLNCSPKFELIVRELKIQRIFKYTRGISVAEYKKEVVHISIVDTDFCKFNLRQL